MVKKRNNDQEILDLKKTIEEKKAALKGATNFKPVTNCSLELDGERFNLHACDPNKLVFIMVRLNALKMSEDALNLDQKLELGGFKLEDWISDCRTKLLVTNKGKEEKRLQALEAQLHELLSAETKTELIISQIKGMI